MTAKQTTKRTTKRTKKGPTTEAPMLNFPVPPVVEGGIYAHYKGGMYQVVACATDEATGCPRVVYKPVVLDPEALSGFTLGARTWDRPESDFGDQVQFMLGNRRYQATRYTLVSSVWEDAPDDCADEPDEDEQEGEV